MTIAELFHRYRAYRINKNVSESTLSNYDRLFERVIEPAIGEVKLSNFIPTDDVGKIEFTARQYTEAKSVPTYSVMLLKQILKYAAESGIKTKFDYRNIRPPKFARGKPVLRHTPETIALVREVLDGSTLQSLRMRAFWEFDLHSGLRRKEALALNREDVDLENCTVKLKDGKNAEPYTRYFAPAACVWLKRYLDRRLDDDPALWYVEPYGGRGGKRMCKDTVQGYMRKLASSEKLKGMTGTHILRKTFCTEIIEDWDIATAQHAVGHKNMDTTKVYYYALEEEKVQKRVQKSMTKEKLFSGIDKELSTR